MKKSILIIATALLSFLQINALNDNTNLNTNCSDVKITTNQIVQIFEWHVTTNYGQYSGTSASMADASIMMVLVNNGELILEKKVESYYVLESDLDLNAIESIYGRSPASMAMLRDIHPLKMLHIE